MAGRAADDIAYLAGLVREADRPRYYAALFAPEPLRSDLLALYGFAAEIERIPDQVREPMLGEIRLKWWRDALTGEGPSEGVSATPALRAWRALAARHSLPDTPLAALIDAVGADLYADPPSDVAALERSLQERASSLFELGAAIAGGSSLDLDHASNHAGIAYGLARRLETLARVRRRRSPAGANASAEPQPDEAEEGTLALVARARQHLDAVFSQTLPREVLPIFLPLAVVAPLLARVERSLNEGVARDPGLSDLELLLRIGWARVRGRLGRQGAGATSR